MKSGKWLRRRNPRIGCCISIRSHRSQPLHIAIKPENVGEAILELKPWGVDVVSGVEASPGVKDPEKLVSFLQIAKSR